MFRRINGNVYKTTNSQCVSASSIKRGTLVSITTDATGRKVSKAGANEDVVGIAVRGEIVDERVAMGFKADIYADSQDLVKTGELLGVEPIYQGDVYATTEFDTSTIKDGKEYGYVKVAVGKLVEATDKATAYAEAEGFHKEPGMPVAMLKFRKL